MFSECYQYTISPEFDGLASYTWLKEPGSNHYGIGYCAASAMDWSGHKSISDQLISDFGSWAIELENEVFVCDERTACAGDYRCINWKNFRNYSA